MSDNSWSPPMPQRRLRRATLIVEDDLGRVVSYELDGDAVKLHVDLRAEWDQYPDIRVWGESEPVWRGLEKIKIVVDGVVDRPQTDPWLVMKMLAGHPQLEATNPGLLTRDQRNGDSF